MTPPDFTLEDILDQRLAIVGMTGSGKSYCAKGLVERLLREQRRVCVIDPLGVWWGLRAGRDGLPAAGLPVVLAGGEHGDVQIARDRGAVVASVVATTSTSFVVDLSTLGSQGARRTFMRAFLAELFETSREPLHLVFDEADMWSPQLVRGEHAVLAGLMEEIVRRGRVYGMLPWLITQRPAVLNKNVLSQADALVALKLVSTQDRKAVGGWIEGQTGDRERERRVLAELPRLEIGTGYVWAPGQNILQLVAFPQNATFDSSSGPKLRAGPPMAPLHDVSVLEALLGAAPAAAPPGREDSPNRHPPALPAPALIHELHERIEQQAREIIRLNGQNAVLATRVGLLEDAIGASRQALGFALSPRRLVSDGNGVSRIEPILATVPIRPAPAPPPRSTGGDEPPHPVARRLLTVLAKHHPAMLTLHQLATLAGLKSSGGHFSAGRAQALRRGWIVKQGDLVGGTACGWKAAGIEPLAGPPPGGDELFLLWQTKLPGPADRMLAALHQVAPSAMERKALANAAGISASGGHFAKGLSLLRNNGLVAELPGRLMRLSDVFWPERLAQ